MKLHCGCGPKIKEGWINIDNFDPSSFSGSKDNIVAHDLSKGIPFSDNSATVVYSEHFVEHLDYPAIEMFIKESYRVLEPGGLFRMSTPDLMEICSYYVFGDMTKFRKLGMSHPDPAYLVNQGLRDWGHKYVLDKKQTRRLLEQVGFKNVQFVNHGQSSHELLRNLETREAGLDFVVEAVK